MTFGDCHVYEAHKDVVEQQLDRTPFVFPQLKITKEITDVSQLEFSDVSITDYKCHGSLKADMVA
jgi:thymidylate synthase